MDPLPAMLTPGEVALLVRVNPKTVTRGCAQGKLAAIVTPGGHRRFPLAVVLAFLADMGFDDTEARDAVRGLR